MLRGSEGLRAAPLRTTPPQPAHRWEVGKVKPMMERYMEVQVAWDTKGK